MSDNGYRELELTELDAPEVGEPVVIETPTKAFTATWLGVVGTGPGAMTLTEAMQLMISLERERKERERAEAQVSS